MRKMHTAIAVVSLMIFAVAVAVTTAGAAPARPKDQMTIAHLRHSVVPAYCEMPRQRLHHNKTAKKYLPKQG
jgi:hypothetical protein